LFNGSIRVSLNGLVFEWRLCLLAVEIVCPKTGCFVGFGHDLFGVPGIAGVGWGLLAENLIYKMGPPRE